MILNRRYLFEILPLRKQINCGITVNIDKLNLGIFGFIKKMKSNMPFL